MMTGKKKKADQLGPTSTPGAVSRITSYRQATEHASANPPTDPLDKGKVEMQDADNESPIYDDVAATDGTLKRGLNATLEYSMVMSRDRGHNSSSELSNSSSSSDSNQNTIKKRPNVISSSSPSTAANIAQSIRTKKGHRKTTTFDEDISTVTVEADGSTGETTFPVYDSVDRGNDPQPDLSQEPQQIYDDVAEPHSDEPNDPDLSGHEYHLVEQKWDSECSEEDKYEPVVYGNSDGSEDDWSGSEYEDIEPHDRQSTANPRAASTDEVDSIRPAGALSKIQDVFKINKDRESKTKSQFYPTCSPGFKFDSKKHPPPQLPDQPAGLSEKQIKRRIIVNDIIEKENSYVQALQLLLENYKRPLIEKGIIPHDKVEKIFFKLDEILQCHLMFQIELEHKISSWDEHECLGSVFDGCFSKAIVMEKYGDFITNFVDATETLKKCQREKAAFREFVNETQKKDLLGPHGQMIRVVQRFPQYILQIKDLVKYTPQAHADYNNLKRALTILENLAFQLNEKKRSSEEMLAAKVMMERLSFNRLSAGSSTLLRQDDVTELVYTKGEPVKYKNRRLLLFNNTICLAKVEKSGTSDEKIVSRWKAPLANVEYKESSASDTLSHSLSSRGSSGSLVLESRKSTSDSNMSLNESSMSIYKEIEDLQRDQVVLSQIFMLVTSLNQPYKGLSGEDIEEHIRSVQTSIKMRDEQLQMMDNCSLTLLVPGKANQENKVVVQLSSPEVKQDWVIDFRSVKLALEEINKNCWITESTGLIRHPLLFKHVPLDVLRQSSQATCAVPIFLTNTSGGIGLQYLWICSNNQTIGNVTIVSLHSKQPYVIQSFDACHGDIKSCLLVPSNIHSSLDHIWMADSTNHVYVHQLDEGKRSTPIRTFNVPNTVIDMLSYGNYVFVALANGCVLKYAKRKGSQLYDEPVCRQLKAGTPVNSLLPRDNNKILAACGNTLYELSTTKNMNLLDKHPYDESIIINKMVSHGSGVWFSSANDSKLRLLQDENFSDIIQDIHIGHALLKLLPKGQLEVDKDRVQITALRVSQGLLWVGTNTGHILSIPVPVQDGLPMVIGKINLSSMCHTGPVMFISAVKCGITYSPQPLTDTDETDACAVSKRLSVVVSTSTIEEDVETSTDDTAETSSVSLDEVKRRSSLAKIKDKMKNRLSNGFMKQSKGLAVSTPNLAATPRYPGPTNQFTADQKFNAMFGSLLRIDDYDQSISTVDLVNALVPVNQTPWEQKLTVSDISSQRRGSMVVTRASSISNIGSAVLRPNSKHRGGIQSMWNLATTSSHSVHSLVNKGDNTGYDKAFTAVNVELREHDRPVTKKETVKKHKRLGKLSSKNDRYSRTISVNSTLSEVAEAEECIYSSNEELSTLEESMDSDGEHGELFETADDNGDNQQTLVVTNYSKATLIISGGQGYFNVSRPDKVIADEASLILWQQTQTWI